MDSARVDRWLWAVRLYRTRSAAGEACRGGHIEINGTKAKPASAVKPGDTVRARVGDRERVVEVVRVVEQRVGAPVAAECMIDRSPPPPPREEILGVPRRDPGAGRPSKRDRRLIDRVRGRS